MHKHLMIPNLTAIALLLLLPLASSGDLTITLSPSGDGFTDVTFSGSGNTTGNGSSTFSASVTNRFLGGDDDSDYFGAIGTLVGTVDGMNVEFVPGLRLADGASTETFQFTFEAGAPFPWHDAGVAYSFSGTGKFTNLPFASFISSGTATSAAGDAVDFQHFSLVVAPAPADPTIGWWRFETVGSSVADSSSAGTHTGIVFNMNAGMDDGNAGFSTDVPGSTVIGSAGNVANTHSLRFDGSNGEVRITGALTDFDFPTAPNAFTLETFFKLDSTNWPMRLFDFFDSTDTAPQTTISPHFTSFGTTPRLAWSIQPSDASVFHTSFANNLTPSPVILDHWHHVAFVKDDTNLFYYLDYQLHSIKQTLGPDGPYTNFDEIALGNLYNGFLNTFDGCLDEMRFSSTALMPSEFLKVESGLPSSVRNVFPTNNMVGVTFVSESGVVYSVQGAGIPSAGEYPWSLDLGTYTGDTFHTTIEISPPSETTGVIRVRR